MTSAARPVVICGKTLYSGAVGLGVYSPQDHEVHGVPVVTAYVSALFQLSTDCSSGVRYSIIPPGLVQVKKQINGTRGGVVALSLVGEQTGDAKLTILDGENAGWSLSFKVTAP